MTDLDKLEAVAKAATQGEWTTYVSGLPEYKNVSHGIEIGPEGALVADFQRKEDCDFVHAAQPATILDLIASARRDAEEIERLREALKPFHAAYIALVETHCSFEVTGETAAERRFSDGEREDAAKEAAFEALTSITFDQLAAVDAALSARAAHTGEG